MVTTGKRPLEDGLVLDLKMSEGAGLIAHDASGERNHGVFGAGAAAPTWAVDDGRSVLDFDGVDDHVNVSDSPSLDVTRITMAVWVYPKTDIVGHNRHFMRRGNLYFLVMQGVTRKLWARIRIGGVPKNAYSTDAIPLNQWTHIAMTYDGGYLRTYINGVLNGTPVGATGNIDPGVIALLLGCYTVLGDDNNFDGLMDEPRVYNRALSAEGVALLSAQRRRM